MEWIFIPVAVAFTVLGAMCLSLIVIGLPGVWIILALAGLIELTDGLYLAEGEQQTFAWGLLGVCVGLAVVGEIIEFLAGILGTRAGGGTKRGMWGALIGGILGAFVLTPFLPIPVVGSLVGALIGTFIGAFLGEISAEQGTIRSSLRPASGATIARVIATFAKMGVAVVVWVTLSVAAFWP